MTLVNMAAAGSTLCQHEKLKGITERRTRSACNPSDVESKPEWQSLAISCFTIRARWISTLRIVYGYKDAATPQEFGIARSYFAPYFFYGRRRP